VELASINVTYVLTSTTYYYTRTTFINPSTGAIEEQISLGSDDRLKAKKTVI